MLGVAVLALAGVYGFASGAALEQSDVLVPTIGALATTGVVIGALIALGARDGRWLATPYW